MTLTQIKEILQTIASELETLNADPTYRMIEDSEEFNTSNDLRLADALQSIRECEGAFLEIICP